MGSFCRRCRSSHSDHVVPRNLKCSTWLDALLRGVTNQSELSLIAKTIYMRPDPTLAERMKYFSVTGTWRPEENPYEREKL